MNKTNEIKIKINKKYLRRRRRVNENYVTFT